MPDFKELTIADIQSKLNQVKQQVADTGFGGYVMNTLVAQERDLQTALNKLLQQKGILSESDADSLYEKLKLDKKNLLEKKAKRGWIVPATIVVGIVAMVYVARKIKLKS